MVFFWAGLSAGLVVGAAGAVFYARRMLKRVRQVERRALDSERLAYVGSLAAGLAHEIKTPLSTLLINLQLLDEDLQKPGAANPQRHVGRTAVLRREVKRLEEVLDDFFRYARKHHLDLKLQNVNDVLDEMLDFVTPEVTRSGIRITRGLSGDLSLCQVDAGRLKQAFLNVLINAKQATPEGGEIIVRTRNVQGGVEIDFIDTGTGISDKDLPHIWDVYYSTKPTGTGLGLPTARKIVEEHGGAVRVNTQVGKGTCFTIFLPVEESNDGV
jgi:signal transduction histidine kinase